MWLKQDTNSKQDRLYAKSNLKSSPKRTVRRFFPELLPNYLIQQLMILFFLSMRDCFLTPEFAIVISKQIRVVAKTLNS